MTNERGSRAAEDGQGLRALTQDVSELIRRLENSSVRRLMIEADGCRIEIERGPAQVGAAPAAVAAGGALPAAAEPQAAAQPDNRHPIVAPLVGRFYRSREPGARPFVEVGDVVDKGQTVGIVEAMKIMNQIQSDQAGRVAEILVPDGEYVEFQQVIMYLEPVEG